MTHDEMRFLRRELIAFYLRQGVKHTEVLRAFVRTGEISAYGYELQAYGG